MTDSGKIRKFLYITSDVYCDDCLSEVLNIYPRQQVNQICNKFKIQAGIKREIKQCSNCSKDKLVNFV